MTLVWTNLDLPLSVSDGSLNRSMTYWSRKALCVAKYCLKIHNAHFQVGIANFWISIVGPWATNPVFGKFEFQFTIAIKS